MPVNIFRPRRMRKNAAMRALVRQTRLSADDFVYPIFVAPGVDKADEISTMPGCFRLSVDNAARLVEKIAALNIRAVEIFGLPEYKDEVGSSAWNDNNTVQRAIAAVKKVAPQLIVISDVCLCQYTKSGHCGVLNEAGCVDNDKTLPLLARVAVSHAACGADIVAPSDMMDGRVAAIRTALDKNGFTDTAVMSYAVKYASAYYAPFREAADSAPAFGDRKSYQMDYANEREALLEAALDEQEGADIIMVKPAMTYLDIVRGVRDNTNLPVAAYNVSGEYAMVKAAAQRGFIDEKKVVLETLTSIKRAGADIIITYHALDAARWLREE